MALEQEESNRRSLDSGSVFAAPIDRRLADEREGNIQTECCHSGEDEKEPWVGQFSSSHNSRIRNFSKMNLSRSSVSVTALSFCWT